MNDLADLAVILVAVFLAWRAHMAVVNLAPLRHALSGQEEIGSRLAQIRDLNLRPGRG